MESARLEAFSDGVFAVAITLLALNLAVPGPGPGHAPLGEQLLRMSVSFGALLWWSIRRQHLKTPLTGTGARWAFIRFAGGNVVYAAAIGVAFVSPLASLIVSGLVAVYYVFEHTPAPAPAAAENSEARSGPDPYDQ